MTLWVPERSTPPGTTSAILIAVSGPVDGPLRMANSRPARGSASLRRRARQACGDELDRCGGVVGKIEPPRAMPCQRSCRCFRLFAKKVESRLEPGKAGDRRLGVERCQGEPIAPIEQDQLGLVRNPPAKRSVEGYDGLELAAALPRCPCAGRRIRGEDVDRAGESPDPRRRSHLDENGIIRQDLKSSRSRGEGERALA